MKWPAESLLPPGWWDASPSPRGVITLPWQLVLSICTPGWRVKCFAQEHSTLTQPGLRYDYSTWSPEHWPEFRPHLHMGMKGFISLKVFIMNNLLWMTIKLEFEWEIFLLLTYCCFSCSLIFKGFKRPLTDADLWALNKTNRSSAVVPPFVKKWKEAESSIRWSAMISHEIRNLFSCSA